MIDLKREKWRYCIFNESRNTYIESIPETKAFWLSKMLYSNKNREKLDELASLQNQVEEVWLQEKLGKQNFH